jgi:copper(I)-binding protein
VRTAQQRLRFPKLLAAGLALGVLLAAQAATPLTVSDAWVRVIPGAEVAAAYFTLHNPGPVPVTIAGVSSPLAAMAMIHETRIVGTQSTMRARAEVVVAPGGTLRFAPEGLHVMLHDLKHPLNVGDAVPLVLELKDGGTLEVSARVRPLAAE